MIVEFSRLKNLIATYILLGLIIAFVLFYLPLGESFNKSVIITIQFLIIGFASVCGIVITSNRYDYSIGMIVWFFCFTFLFCGGLTQFANSAFRWELFPSNKEVFLSNNLILIWMIAYTIARCSKNRINLKRKKAPFFDQTLAVDNNRILWILIALLIYGMYVLSTTGWDSMLMRSAFGSNSIISQIGSQASRTLIVTMIRGICLWLMMISIDNYKKKKSGINAVFVVLAIVVGILNVPPFGVARYVFAAVYGGVIIYSFKFLQKKRILLYALSFGLLIVFPLMNAFRGIYTETISFDLMQNSMGNISSNFARADYDAYTMLVYTVRYCSIYGITFGKQLLGVLLFFVPGSIWIGKPGGSGATIIETMVIGVNPNVSCPIMAEGYINFGIIGVVLFALLFGFITSHLDRKYWNDWREEHKVGEMFYTFSIFFFMFLCRGDLLSTFSFFVGYMVALYLVIKFLNRKNNNLD